MKRLRLGSAQSQSSYGCETDEERLAPFIQRCQPVTLAGLSV